MASEARVSISSDADIVTARQKGRALATQAGFSGSQLTVISTAISEIARNIVEYANRGEMEMVLVKDSGKHGIRIVAHDAGPGISDINLALQDGYSTSKSLGLGLPGARRLMDEFDIVSEIGNGTTVTMTKWI